MTATPSSPPSPIVASPGTPIPPSASTGLPAGIGGVTAHHPIPPPASTGLPPLGSRLALAAHRDQVASELERLSSCMPQGAKAEQLGHLAEAIRQGGDAESAWRGVSLAAHFPAEATLRQRSKSVVEALLSTAAAGVVFLPVLWTWLGLREALRAYHGVIATGVVEPRSFLTLWAGGFDGRLPEHLVLSEVALGSVLLLTISVALVLVERVYHHALDARHHARRRALAAQLSAALLVAQQLLRLGAVETPGDTLEQVHDAAVALNEAHKATAAATQLITQMTAALHTNVAKASAALEEAVRKSAQELTLSAEASAAALQDAASTALGDLTVSVSAMAQAADTQTKVAAEAREQSTALADAAAAIQKGAGALTTNLEAMVGDLTATVGPLLAAMEARAAELQSGNADFSLEIRHHAQALQCQISELTQIRTELARIQAATAKPLLRGAPR